MYKLIKISIGIISLIGLGFQFSCISSSDKQKEIISNNIKQYLTAKSLDNKEDVIIDSIQILRIDTLTPKQDSIILSRIYFNDSNKVYLELNDLMDQAKLYQRSAKLNKEIGLDYSDDAEKSKDYLQKAIELQSHHKNLINSVIRIDSIVKLQKIDSVTITGFGIHFNIYAHSSSHQNKDIKEVVFFLDKNYRINEQTMRELGLMEK